MSLLDNITNTASNTVDNPHGLTPELAYYARHGAALFPIHAGKKEPTGIVTSWAFDWSTNPAQWQAWRTAHPDCNFGVVACATGAGWITCDIDIPEGPDGKQLPDGRAKAWAAWCELCKSWGLPGPAMPHCQSAGGAWHCHFQVPTGVDASQLRQPNAVQGEVTINIRVRGYTVAAGSYYDGLKGKVAGWYILQENAPPPHPAPAALVEHCTRKIGGTNTEILMPDYNDTAAFLLFMKEELDYWEDEQNYFEIGAALRLHFEHGPGLELWKVTFRDASHPKGPPEKYTYEARWDNFPSVYKPGMAKLNKFMKIGHDNGWTGTIKPDMGRMLAKAGIIPAEAAVQKIADDAGAKLPPATRDLFACSERPAASPDTPSPTVAPAPAGVTLDDFVAYLPEHTYIFLPNGKHWPKESINSTIAPRPLFHPSGLPVTNEKGKQITIPASEWLDRNQPVHDMTWAPGEMELIEDKITCEGGWTNAPGRKTFNLYKPPEIKPQAGDASPWTDHIRKLYPGDADHIIGWLAHRVQRPGDKINHALVLGGPPGIGKDTALEPVITAVGPWNFKDISPSNMFDNFNPWVKSVILRINEVHNLGDVNRYSFYENSKTYAAAPPATLSCNEKHRKQYSVFNVCGAIMTTNHLSDGMYLPANDRRHYVAWSELVKDDFEPDYFANLYKWYANGGNEIVAHYLLNLDISGFDAKAPPNKTEAFWTIVEASRAPEESEMADALDRLQKRSGATCWPDAVTLEKIADGADENFRAFLSDRRNRKAIPHRLSDCEYVQVRNQDAKDGLWKIGGKRQAAYARKELCMRDQLAAVAKLALPPSPPLPG